MPCHTALSSHHDRLLQPAVLLPPSPNGHPVCQLPLCCPHEHCPPFLSLCACRTCMHGLTTLHMCVHAGGWGLSGMCPGPLLVSLAVPNLQSAAYGVAMLAGMYADHVAFG